MPDGVVPACVGLLSPDAGYSSLVARLTLTIKKVDIRNAAQHGRTENIMQSQGMTQNENYRELVLHLSKALTSLHAALI
jgi:hypothetical protein